MMKGTVFDRVMGISIYQNWGNLGQTGPLC